jgi:6-phosphogluconate dehydrogenase
MELGIIELGRQEANMVAMNESVAASGLHAALYQPLGSHGEDDFGNKTLPALPYQFGGHEEKAAAKRSA